MTVVVVPAARWLSSTISPVRRAIVLRAMADIGVEELTGHNDSPYIAECLRLAGTDPGQAWCAAANTRWSADAGAPHPPPGRAASVREWEAWAKETGRWIPWADYKAHPAKVEPGDSAVYQYSEGMHIERVVRTELGAKRVLRVVGANTSWAGFSRDATCCTMKPAHEDALIGFVRAE